MNFCFIVASFVLVYYFFSVTVGEVDHVIPNYGVGIYRLARGSNNIDMPVLVVKIPKIEGHPSFNAKIDTSKLRDKIKLTSKHPIYKELGKVLDVVDETLSLLNKPRRNKRSFFSGLINLFFGDSSGNGKAARDNAKAIEQTNVAVSDLSKGLKIEVDTEKKDITKISDSVRNISHQLKNITDTLSANMDKLAIEINAASDERAVEAAISRVLAILVMCVTQAMDVKYQMWMLKERQDSLRNDARIGRLSEKHLPRSKLSSLLDDLQGQMNKEGLSLSIRYVGEELSYYYSLTQIHCIETDQSFVYSVNVPVRSVTGSISLYKINTWPVGAGAGLKVGMSLRFPEKCVLVSDQDLDKAAFVRCDSVVHSQGILYSTTSVLSRSDYSLCVQSLIIKDWKTCTKHCRGTLIRRHDGDFIHVRGSTFQINGKVTYVMMCGNTNHAPKTCTDCIITLPCRCFLKSKNSVTPMKLRGCTKLRVEYTAPKPILDITHADVSEKISGDDMLSKPVKLKVTKKLDITEIDKSVAEIHTSEVDLQKAIQSTVTDASVHLTRSSAHIKQAITDSYNPFSGASLGLSILEIVLFAQLQILTVYVFFKLCSMHGVMGIQNYSVPESVTINMSTAIGTEQKVTIAITCVCTVLIALTAIYPLYKKYKQRKPRSGFDVSCLVLSKKPMTFKIENTFDHVLFQNKIPVSAMIEISENSICVFVGDKYMFKSISLGDEFPSGVYACILCKNYM